MKLSFLDNNNGAQSAKDALSKMKILVMGLGLNGGGLETAIFFAKIGSDIIVTDLKSYEELKPSVEKLSKFKNIKFVLGHHDTNDFKWADLVIKNPIVHLKGNPYLKEAKNIQSDVSLFSYLTKAPLLAITGTKGKSFTSTALHYGLLKLGFNSFLGGNIGKCPLAFLEKTSENTPIVLELSSWQLKDLKQCEKFKPHIAIVTPIMEDHQNWYKNMEEYVLDKSVIYENQTKEDFLILNYDDAWGKKMGESAKANIFWYSEKPLPKGVKGCFFDSDGNGVLKNEDAQLVKLLGNDLKIVGNKLKQNLLNASLALYLLGAPSEKIAKVMKDFTGIEHRMELFFTTKNNISFYNDSAATIPEATCAALSSFKEKPILITGGTDKSLNFAPLANNAYKAKKIFLLKGSATCKLIPLLKEKNIEYNGPYEDFNTLLLKLKNEVQAGDNVILSPASSSFELFKNEFDRGNQFKNKVKEIFE